MSAAAEKVLVSGTHVDPNNHLRKSCGAQLGKKPRYLIPQSVRVSAQQVLH